MTTYEWLYQQATDQGVHVIDDAPLPAVSYTHLDVYKRQL